MWYVYDRLSYKGHHDKDTMRVTCLVGGRFKERLTRFSCMVEVSGTLVPCYLPNSGRLEELLLPGKRALLMRQKSKKRKTCYDLFALRHRGIWVVVDSRVPNRLVYEALVEKDIPELRGYPKVRKETSYGSSRLDFLLSGGEGTCLLEVKSCTLVEGGVAMFPDAPTSRGRRHVEELLQAKKQGHRACILFIIQRNDARVFQPNDRAHREFGDTLRKAASEGVEVLAYASAFNGTEVRLTERVPINL
jgi:sugar fermentation stimulation protein A